MQITCATPTLMHQVIPDTIWAPEQTNNPFHALKQNDNNGDSTVPPHGHHPCYWHWCHKPQPNVQVSPLSNRPCPQGFSMMTLLPQVCPGLPHNRQSCRCLQGCPIHQVLLPIKQGHDWYCQDSVSSWNWCSMIFPPQRLHNHRTL